MNDKMNKQVKLDVEAIVADSREEIQRALVEQVKQNIVDGLYYGIRERVAESAKQYLDEEIAPMVKVELANHREELVKAIAAGVLDAFEKVREKVVQNAAKNIGGYKGDQLLKDLFS